jgi:hypothetical protein
MPLPPEIARAALTPEGVRFATDEDRKQVLAAMQARAARIARREPLRLEAEEVADLPALLGGRAVRPTQNLTLYFPGGQKMVQVAPRGRMEAAQIQDVLLRKMEEGRVAPKKTAPKPGPAGSLVIAQAVAKTFRGKVVR